MKRKLISGLLGAMMVMSLAACGKSQNNVGKTAEDYKEYITLADYKAIEVEADKSSLEITKEEMQAEIDACLEAAAETKQVKTGKVKDGDTINLDYSGLLNGVAFAGGTATDATYTVGGNFIEDLDRGFIGLEVGKEYEIPCRFPDNYGNAELNGKDVIFVVTVNYIEELVLPEYNDELVKKITADSDVPLNTTAELEASITEYLTTQKQSAYNGDIYNQMMTKLLETSEFKSIPEDEVNGTVEIMKKNAQIEFEQYGAMYDISTMEEFIIKLYGYESMEAYEADIKDYATQYVKEKMAVLTIAANEGIAVTKDEVDEYAKNLATDYGYESVDALEKSYGDTLYEDINYEMIYERVYDKLVSYAVIK